MSEPKMSFEPAALVAETEGDFDQSPHVPKTDDFGELG
jgi:hypothetical protein